MSKIKRYIAFCEENGYTNRHGEVVSMKHAEEYMKTQKYAEEHDEQERMRADAIFEEEKERRAGFFNENSHPK